MGKKTWALLASISLLIIASLIFLSKQNNSKEEIFTLKMKIESPAFENNQRIPKKYTADGEDISPPLIISGIPKDAKSLVLINDDPDAPIGTWVHWVVFDIPIKGESLTIREGEVPEGAKLGINDFKKLEYGGPAPPSGTHRYFFKVYALDKMLNLEEGVTKSEIERFMQGHILDKAELVGLYSR